MQAHALRLLAVRDVETERTDRRPETSADAVTVRGRELGHLVLRVAGVDERSHAPRLVDPVHGLDAADPVIAAADHRVALLHAEALERVAAHGRVAARA